MARIEHGTLCLVIGGSLGLNLGKRVVASAFVGEHTKLGRIWRCTAAPGNQLVTEYGAVGISADFAEDWLEPAKPPPLAATSSVERLAA